MDPRYYEVHNAHERERRASSLPRFKKLDLYLLIFSHACECLDYIYIHLSHMHVFCPRRSEEVTGSPGTCVMDGPEPPCDCLETNPDPLQHQQLLLMTEPSH